MQLSFALGAPAPEPPRRLKTDAELEQEEAERLAEEYARRLVEHQAILDEQWDVFQKTKFDAPPKLLPLEAAQELNTFHSYLEDQIPFNLMSAAIESFNKDVHLKAQEAELAVDQLRQELQSASRFAGLLGPMGFGKIREIFQKCLVSVEVPNLGTAAHEAIAESCKFLRKKWSEQLELKQQAIFSIHRDGEKNVIHIGSSLYGSVFITLPHSMNPEEIARALLAEFREAASKLITDDSTLAVIDGDHQTLNYQRIFDQNIVVRSVKADCNRVTANLDLLLKREPPTAENTALHFGLPTNERELKSVFEMGERGEVEKAAPDWTLWNGVSPLWQNRARRHGFDAQPSASATQVLDSLMKDKNVIVVIAHGDHRSIYLPAPAPEGSELSADQIIERKIEITANKPVVYLFCCETADISDLKSFAEILLDSGAAAVIAPQTKIDAERSADFFEGIVQKENNGHKNSLTKFQAAVRQSKYSEMEVFLG